MYGMISAAEDIDPTIGKFRNMVQTAVIPAKVGCCVCVPVSVKTVPLKEYISVITILWLASWMS